MICTTKNTKIRKGKHIRLRLSFVPFVVLFAEVKLHA
jgi:hypothetical protein